MENWLYASAPIIIRMLITAVIIFAIMIVIVRVFGLRTFAKMSSFDFATTIAIGSILASALVYDDISILKLSLAMVMLIAMQTAFSYLKKNSDFFSKLTTNQPLLLMEKGEIIQENLDKSGVSVSDLTAKLREANVIQLSEVYAVVLETTGDVSVLHGKEDLELDKFLLKNIKR